MPNSQLTVAVRIDGVDVPEYIPLKLSFNRFSVRWTDTYRRTLGQCQGLKVRVTR